MTEHETIELLSRWVYELRVDLTVAGARQHQLEQRVRHLEKRMNGFEFWMRSGLTPNDIHHAARELDPAVVGAAT